MAEETIKTQETMNIIENPLPEKQRKRVYNQAYKADGYLKLCEHRLVHVDDEISHESPEHAIIQNALKSIRQAISEMQTLIARTRP